MDHHDLLELSLKISKIENQQEVVTRNGIGRLYYFCYHEALALINSSDELKTIYHSLTKMGSHKKVATVFLEYAKKSKEQKYSKVSRLLKVMHGFRCDADYDIDCHISSAELMSMITTLKLIKDTLSSLDIPYFQVNIDNYIPVTTKFNKKTTLRIVE